MTLRRSPPPTLGVAVKGEMGGSTMSQDRCPLVQRPVPVAGSSCPGAQGLAGRGGLARRLQEMKASLPLKVPAGFGGPGAGRCLLRIPAASAVIPGLRRPLKGGSQPVCWAEMANGAASHVQLGPFGDRMEGFCTSRA